MVFLVEGDGRLGPLEPCRGSEGVDDVHLLLGDAALPVGLIRLGAPVNPEAALGLGELVVFLLGAVHRVIGLRASFWAKGLKRLLKVFRSITATISSPRRFRSLFRLSWHRWDEAGSLVPSPPLRWPVALAFLLKLA